MKSLYRLAVLLTATLGFCLIAGAQVSGSFTLSTNRLTSGVTNTIPSDAVFIGGARQVAIGWSFTTNAGAAGLGTATLVMEGSMDATAFFNNLNDTNYVVNVCACMPQTNMVVLDTRAVQWIRVCSLGNSATNSTLTNMAVRYFYK